MARTVQRNQWNTPLLLWKTPNIQDLQKNSGTNFKRRLLLTSEEFDYSNEMIKSKARSLCYNWIFTPHLQTQATCFTQGSWEVRSFLLVKKIDQP